VARTVRTPAARVPSRERRGFLTLLLLDLKAMFFTLRRLRTLTRREIALDQFDAVNVLT
jgi:hypothetical protein